MEGMREFDTEWSRGVDTLLEVLGNDRLWVDRVGAARRVDRVDCMLDRMRTGFEQVTMRERALAFSSLRTVVRVVRLTRHVLGGEHRKQKKEYIEQRCTGML